VKRVFILLGVLSLFLPHALKAQTVESPIAPIATSEGQVAGKVLSSGVKAWLGVPFARPPVQALRWQPPQPIHWNGVWNADRMMPECIQALRPRNINNYFGDVPSAEDCLYLNIWAPGDAHAGSHLPVMVFIHGGATIGSGASVIYSGEPMARTGKVIFVNLNYRLGLLGFMAHPELTREQGGHSGNYGLLDQNAALKWVHDNIALFGGDPSKITLVGQSTGATSITAQLFSPLSKNLFHGAVLLSGCDWDTNFASLAQGEAQGLQIQKMLGAANLDEMRQLPADKIISAQAENAAGMRHPGFRILPVMDGYFATMTPTEALKAHAFNDVPIIASFDRDEADATDPLTTVKTAAEYRATVAALYGADAPAFLELFPVSQDSNAGKVAVEAAREADLEVPARNCARLRDQYGTSPTYIGMFTRGPSFVPGAKIADIDSATAGVYHAADLPFWLGTLDSLNILRKTRNWTDTDRQLSAEMMDTLVAFADTGNPNTAHVAWAPWSPDDEQKIIFGDKIAMAPLDVGRLSWLAAHPAGLQPAAQPPRVQPSGPALRLSLSDAADASPGLR
jgi:para-nitrobenzyl esterase